MKLTQALHAIDDLYPITIDQEIFDGILPEEKLCELAIQVYLQEKWPSHAANVYLRMDEEALANRDLVGYIISIIKAENLGVGSQGTSHADLAKRFIYSMGVCEKRLTLAVPTIENRTLMDWCDMSALDRPWMEALAVQVACEGQVTAMAKIARGITRHYKTSTSDAQLWFVHGGRVERKHKKDGLALLGKYTPATKHDDVIYAYAMTARLNCAFYNSFGEKRTNEVI